MPVNPTVANQQFELYAYARDHGHSKYVAKDKKCHEYMAGQQWDPITAMELARQRKPNLTINKVYATVVTALGIQLNSKADIIVRPVGGVANDETASALSRVIKHIAQRNKLSWKESDLFQYAMIGSRAYFDVRMEFDDKMMAHAKITRVHGRNVVLDPEASEYDPAEWKRLFITKWLTGDDIRRLYNAKDAKYLEEKGVSAYAGGYDSIDDDRPSGIFGEANDPFDYTSNDEAKRGKRMRVLEHQFKVRKKKWHFVDPETGELTRVPPEIKTRQQREKIARLTGLELLNKEVQVIHWRVTCDDCVLHDEESPYPHFTIVPYFPILDDGKTMGPVEHLIDPQDQLNKTESQILHTINTTSNSGWMTKKNNIKNMSSAQLEQQGGKTGLVLEVDDISQTEKITPNSVPTGLENFSNKADNFIKELAGQSDSMRGFDRADVSAKAIGEKKQSGAVNMAKYMDNLDRTRYILAEKIIWIIQNYYTEERLLKITTGGVNGVGGRQEEIAINQTTPEGTIANDVTLGEYGITISSVPAQDLFEDTQFQQAVAMKTELGMQIPDAYIIEKSSLTNKAELMEQMQQGPTPEQQRLQELEFAEREAAVAKTNAETKEIEATIVVKLAQARQTMINGKKTEWEASNNNDDLKGLHDAEVKERQMTLQERTQLFNEKQHADTMAQQNKDRASAKPSPKKTKAA